MKKLMLIIFLLSCLIFAFSAGPVAAEQWFPTNQITVGWDAVAPLAAGDTISYLVFLKNASDGSIASVGETTETKFTITVTVEGKFYAGVQTKRVTADGTELLSEETNWSDVDEPAGSTPNPFGVVFYVAPNFPMNQRAIP